MWQAAQASDDDDTNNGTIIMQNSTPTLALPTLGKNNYPIWQFAITNYIAELGLSPYLEANIQAPADPSQQAQHDKNMALTKRIIGSTLSSNVLTAVGVDILNGTPGVMLSAIENHFKAEATPAEHERLQQRASKMTINVREELDAYIDRHLEQREAMIRAQVPGITDERVTVAYAVRGLQSRPSMKPLIPLLLTQRPATMRELRQLLELLQPNTEAGPSTRRPRYWCEYHQSHGSHTTAQCRQLQYDQMENPAHNPSQQRLQHRGRPHRGGPRYGVGRGRGRPQYNPTRKPFAHAVTFHEPEHQQEPYPQNVDTNDEQEPYGQGEEHHEVNDNDFEYYYLDSCCTPSYITKRPGHFLPHNSDVILPDSTTIKTRHSGNLSLATTDGGKIQIPLAMHAPSFPKNLLSVQQLAQANNWDIVFQPMGGYIIPHSPTTPPQTITKFTARAGLYCLPLRTHHLPLVPRSSTKPPHAANVAQKQTHLSKFFKHKKPRPKPAILPQPKPPNTIHAPHPPARPRGYKLNKLTHRVPLSPLYPPIPNDMQDKTRDQHYWHLIMNHLHPGALRAMAHSPNTHGLPVSLRRGNTPLHCHGCTEAHMQRAPHNHTTPRPPPGHTIVSDIGGPFIPTVNGHRYFITFTELHTRLTTTTLLKKKSDAEHPIRPVIARTRQHFGKPIAIFRTDNANEYLTTLLQRLLPSMGTSISPTTPHTPQENAISERLNRTLIQRVRATLETCRLPFDKYWAYGLLDTTVKHNSSYHSTIANIPRHLWNINRSAYSPFPLKPLDYSQFRMFGEYGYIPNLKTVKGKNEKRGTLVRYLYTTDHAHYKVLNPKNGQLLTTRITNFKMYNPRFDPTTTYIHPFPLIETVHPRVNAHHVIPQEANATTTAHTPTAPQRILMNPPLQATPRAPKTLAAARRSQDSNHWKAAYQREVAMHDAFRTFKYIPKSALPHNANVVRPVLTLRYKADKTCRITGHKARCSYPGNRMTPGIDFDPATIAAHAADRDAMRLLLSLSVQYNTKVRHIDITSAFLNEKYKGDAPLYMQPLPNFDGTPRHRGAVAVVQQNIWGTPQGPRTYADGLRRHLIESGYTQLRADTNLYTKKKGDKFLHMAITMDDFAVNTNSNDMYQQLMNDLRRKYQTKDLGLAHHIIGWSLTYTTNNTLHISQPALTQAYIELLNMSAAKPAHTPYLSGVKLHPPSKDEKILDTSRHPVRKALGMLRYLVDSTRPDLAYVTNAIARCAAHPTARHWLTLKQIARYLKNTATHGLLYRKGRDVITAASDADFAGCTATRQSTYGNVTYHAGNPISWTSRRIKTIVDSTFAAEYIAASHAAQHAKWLRTLHTELCQGRPIRIRLLMDNQGAIAGINAAAPTKKTKYIDIRYHIIQQMKRENIIKPVYTPTAELKADTFTKPLNRHAYAKHNNTLNIVALPHPRL